MRKLAVLTFVTLDGVMQAAGGPQEDTSGGFKLLESGISTTGVVVAKYQIAGEVKTGSF